MTSKRRMGPETSATRARLMDAVDAVMREQGYAALSARNVARRAGLKYQLIFYYFETMDDLLLATYRRRTRSVLERTEAALRTERPLHAVWKASADPFDAALSIEYLAMSSHNALIRAETIGFGEQLRAIMAEKLGEQLRRAAPEPEVFTPVGITVAITLMGGILGFESAVGLAGGHSETEAIVEWCLRQLEPESVRPENVPEAT